MSGNQRAFTILIVDDNPNNLKLLGKVLQEENYDIEFALDGASALDWLNTKKFDLVLLDINMPGMNGFDVCRKIRADDRLSRIPVFFLSAESEREIILKGFELGAQDYVIKPFDSREILARVRTHYSLRESIEKLAEVNFSLETIVNERTQQLKEANNRLEEANARLNELDKAKSEFLKMISLQIRTPLNGIVGPLYLMKEEEKSGELMTLVEILDQSVKKLEKFSLNALLITQLSINGEKFPSETIVVSDLLSACQADSQINYLSSKRNVAFNVTGIPEDVVIQGNRELLSTVILNILENSLMYSYANTCVLVGIDCKVDTVSISISDTGPGFPESFLMKINKMMSDKEELNLNYDTGLGLNLVKLIMKLHSGKIELMNYKNGARVVLHLPVFNCTNSSGSGSRNEKMFAHGMRGKENQIQ